MIDCVKSFSATHSSKQNLDNKTVKIKGEFIKRMNRSMSFLY